MLIPISIEFFGVGKDVKQRRRSLTINSTTSNVRKLTELREGLLETGRDFLTTPGSKRLFRDISSYTARGDVPEVRLGTRTKGYRSLRDSGDVFRFIAIMEQDNPSLRSSSHLRIIVTGYTDRAEIGRDGLPDPDTMMHINSVTTYRVTSSGLSGEDKYQVVDNSVVVLPYYKGRSIGSREKREFLSTPGMLSEYADQDEEGVVDDHSTNIIIDAEGQNAKTVRHGIITPDKFISTLTRSEFDSVGDKNNTTGGILSGNMLGQSAYTKFRLQNDRVDNNIRSNTFYESFSDSVARGEDVSIDLRRDAGFTLSDLMDACDIRERDMERFIYVENNFETVDFDAEDWGGADENTMGAYDICFRIPEIMLLNQIKGCSFTITNHGSRLSSRSVEPEFMFLSDINERGDESYNIVPVSGTGDIPASFLDKFEDEIINEVFDPLSDYGKIPLAITVFSSLGGLTRVEIGYDDRQEEPFIFYSFMESRLNHTINYTGDERFNTLVKDYRELRDEVNAASLLYNGKSNERNTITDDGRARSGLSRSNGGGLLSGSKNTRRSGSLSLRRR